MTKDVMQTAALPIKYIVHDKDHKNLQFEGWALFWIVKINKYNE